jgi:hypothetical protein
MKKLMTLKGGTWAWGIVTGGLAVIVVFVILTGWPGCVYTRIKDAATALGAVIAASALAWSHFFQTASRREESAKLEELSHRVAEVSRKLDKLSQRDGV